MLARTLKNWRLYEGQGSTAGRFCAELSEALRTVLDQHGPLTLRFTAQDILLDRQPLIAEQASKEAIAVVFHRDGVRGICFKPGIGSSEVGGVLDAIVRSGKDGSEESDLVTLLWDADLPHVELEVVPLEADIREGAEDPSPEAGSFMPWPAGGFSAEDLALGAGPGATTGEAEGKGRLGRSDDWLTLDSEAGSRFSSAAEEARWPPEVERFRQEYGGEHGPSLILDALNIIEACLSECPDQSEADDFAQFLTSLTRTAVVSGAWTDAQACLVAHRRRGGDAWSAERFGPELQRSVSMAALVQGLDRQPPAEVSNFISFARELGAAALPWLAFAMAESGERRHRRLLAQAVADCCRDDPRRLDPWLADPRWYVVRNVVYVLGMIGGAQIAPLLQAVIHHSDYRVQRQVILALKGLDHRLARPLLLQMLSDESKSSFCMVLEALSLDRAPEVAQALVAYLTAADFHRRPREERNAIVAAIGATANDSTLPLLETQLLGGKLFARSPAVDCEVLAGCVAQIGTPAAKVLLERGTRAWQGNVRKACANALAGLRRHA
jgi:hypothetical protein